MSSCTGLLDTYIKIQAITTRVTNALNKPFMLIAVMVPGEQGWGLQEVAQAVTYIHHDTLPS